MFQRNSGFDRKNNFNLIRIYLSLSVYFFHSYELTGEPELSFLNKLFIGDKAVQAFFVISGYLIMKSYYRCDTVKDFLIKRIRRIYPGYLTIILLCALLGFIVSEYPICIYFTSPDLYKYIAANLVFLNFLQPSLPGVFTHHLFTAVNGSLWTLKLEVAYYLLVPLIAILRSKMNVHLLYAILFLSSVSYLAGMKHLYKVYGGDEYLFLSRQIPGQLFFFIIGAWIMELEIKDWLKPAIRWLGVPCMIALFFPMPVMVQSILLAGAVFFWAHIVPMINYPYKDEDISYGIYIYHFPVIQVLVYYQVYAYSALAGLMYTLIFTFGLAILSWFFMEKPFTKRKRNRVPVFTDQHTANDQTSMMQINR
jgi:peptidoglycan/LPS O-acetylase OafA/YrhL